MTPYIFISYRRDDTSGYAGRLYDQISAHFGADHVFMDVANLEPGSDFVDTIEKKVGMCDALIALIGKNWLTIKDDQNQVRLAKPGDFVSIEIAAALKRNIEVIPVLVGGARMPLQRDLPESLQSLCRRQALEISDVHFTRDEGDLIEALKRGSGSTPAKRWTLSKLALAVTIALVLALATGFSVWGWRNSHPPVTRTVASIPTVPIPSKVVENTSITGDWLAVVRKGKVTYEVYFTFEAIGNKLFGRAIYPTGEAGILNGSVSDSGLAFTTKHIPDFADEEATITVEGTISGQEIQVIIQDKDGYSKGVAHRVSKTGRPRVLTP